MIIKDYKKTFVKPLHRPLIKYIISIKIHLDEHKIYIKDLTKSPNTLIKCAPSPQYVYKKSN